MPGWLVAFLVMGVGLTAADFAIARVIGPMLLRDAAMGQLRSTLRLIVLLDFGAVFILAVLAGAAGARRSIRRGARHRWTNVVGVLFGCALVPACLLEYAALVTAAIPVKPTEVNLALIAAGAIVGWMLAEFNRGIGSGGRKPAPIPSPSQVTAAGLILALGWLPTSAMSSPSSAPPVASTSMQLTAAAMPAIIPSDIQAADCNLLSVEESGNLGITIFSVDLGHSYAYRETQKADGSWEAQVIAGLQGGLKIGLGEHIGQKQLSGTALSEGISFSLAAIGDLETVNTYSIVDRGAADATVKQQTLNYLGDTVMLPGESQFTKGAGTSALLGHFNTEYPTASDISLAGKLTLSASAGLLLSYNIDMSVGAGAGVTLKDAQNKTSTDFVRKPASAEIYMNLSGDGTGEMAGLLNSFGAKAGGEVVMTLALEPNASGPNFTSLQLESTVDVGASGGLAASGDKISLVSAALGKSMPAKLLTAFKGVDANSNQTLGAKLTADATLDFKKYPLDQALFVAFFAAFQRSLAKDATTADQQNLTLATRALAAAIRNHGDFTFKGYATNQNDQNVGIQVGTVFVNGANVGTAGRIERLVLAAYKTGSADWAVSATCKPSATPSIPITAQQPLPAPAPLPVVLGPDHDGIPAALKTSLAEQYAPTYLFAPSEPDYPIGVDAFLSLPTPPSLTYHEDCPAIGHLTNNLVAPGGQGPINQDGLLHSATTSSSCSGRIGGDPFVPMGTESTNPDAIFNGHNSETYYLGWLDPSKNDAPGLIPKADGRSLDPSHWITYYHEYPTSDGGIMIQYWLFFANNNMTGSVADNLDQHGGDWDGNIQVQLDHLMRVERVWFSRHFNAYPGDYMNSVESFVPDASTQPLTTYFTNQTHPLVMLDSGSHAAFASPADYCAYKGAGPINFTGDAVWGDPAHPEQLRKIDCADHQLPVVGGLVGGTSWATTTNGTVHVDKARVTYVPNGSRGGPLRNLGEYNPGGMADCSTCAGIPPQNPTAGADMSSSFFPSDAGTFPAYSGLWGSPNSGDHSQGVPVLGSAFPPRGPVFQGYDKSNNVYTTWFNQASSSRWAPTPIAQLASCTFSGPIRCPVGTPSAPPRVVAKPGPGYIDVSWSPPARSGSSAITKYAVVVAEDNSNGSGTQDSYQSQFVSAPTTTLRVSGLKQDCHQRYTVTVAAINGAGQGPSWGASAPVRPSGFVPSSEPKLVIVLLDGVESFHDAATFNPLGPVTTDGLHSYCPESPSGYSSQFTLGLDDFMHKWNFTQATPVSTADGVKLTHHFLLDAFAAQGAVVLPYSYSYPSGAKLLPNGTFTSASYTLQDSSNGKLDQAASLLGQEIDSIHKTWGTAQIVVIGHSNGGLVAATWWDTQFISQKDHHGVSFVFTLDSPLNGVRFTGCQLGSGFAGVPCDYSDIYLARWQERQSRAEIWIPQDLTAGESLRPIGTLHDPTYVQGDNLTNLANTDTAGGDSNNNSLCSQLLLPKDGCAPFDAVVPPDFVSTCTIEDNGPAVFHNAAKTGHFVVKFCPGVISYVTNLVLGGPGP